MGVVCHWFPFLKLGTYALHSLKHNDIHSWLNPMQLYHRAGHIMHCMLLHFCCSITQTRYTKCKESTRFVVFGMAAIDFCDSGPRLSFSQVVRGLEHLVLLLWPSEDVSYAAFSQVTIVISGHFLQHWHYLSWPYTVSCQTSISFKAIP